MKPKQDEILIVSELFEQVIWVWFNNDSYWGKNCRIWIYFLLYTTM